jgi:hypothetical protein
LQKDAHAPPQIRDHRYTHASTIRHCSPLILTGEPGDDGASLPYSPAGAHYRWPTDAIPIGEMTDRHRTAPWGEEAAVPSSMIFVGLVFLWLLILVPTVARHRQEVVRPSVAALSGRVLERPRRRNLEVDVMDETESRTVVTRVGDEEPPVPAARSAAEDDDAAEYTDDDRGRERPPPRYRPGRGGFDPDAAAMTARARYGFRQRVVLTLLVVAVVSGVVAGVALPALWWVHGAVDIILVGYLVYLRRQVRMEEAIRDRRAARMGGAHRRPAADDPEIDERARRGREEAGRAEPDDSDEGWAGEDVVDQPDEADGDELELEEPERVLGTGASLKDATELSDPVEEIALPRLQPAPPLALPAGTSLVQADEGDPDLYDLGGPSRPDYRHAVGE